MSCGTRPRSALRSSSRTLDFRSRSCLEKARSTAPRSNTTWTASAAPGSVAPCRSISPCRVARGGVNRGGQRPPRAGDAASRDRRFHGTVHRHSHRALRGALPVWLAPVQTVVLNITEHQSSYAEAVTAELKRADVRAKADLRNEKISIRFGNIVCRSCPTRSSSVTRKWHKGLPCAPARARISAR